MSTSDQELILSSFAMLFQRQSKATHGTLGQVAAISGHCKAVEQPTLHIRAACYFAPSSFLCGFTLPTDGWTRARRPLHALSQSVKVF